MTVATAAAWDAMTTVQFQAYSALVIGDPSTTSCSSAPPAAAVSDASTWEAAVSGNVALIGTAPAFAGSAGSALISDGMSDAVGVSGKTGLYVSLNCEDSTDAAGMSVGAGTAGDGGWLNGVEDPGGAGFTLTGRAGSCPNSGAVNMLEADTAPAFNGLASSSLASWATPACSVQESFNTWPADFTPVAYDAAAAPADFTASDGVTGQPYVLLGAPVSAATAALAPSAGGEVPAGSAGSGSNPAAPGVSQATAGDPVNTENGDFTQSSTDLSIPTFGPALDFTRSYDAQAGEQQTQTGMPGPLGYGWTDNWASSLSTGKPAPGDIYSLDGSASDLGDGGPAVSAPLDSPGGVFIPPGSSNIYIADTLNNRVQEIAGATGTQWGVPMTAGNVYTIAGSATGTSGFSGDGGPATAALLNQPRGVTMDSSGNLYIADSDNNRIQEVAAASGSQRGQTMTAGDIYTVAGQSNGNSGSGGDGAPATSASLNGPVSVTTGPGNSNLYIADSGNNRIQEVAAGSGPQWGTAMTANDIYTVAGSPAGTPGDSGDGGAAASALLDFPQGVSVGSAGDLYIADTDNSRIQEVAAGSGTQWGTAMTANDIYTVAGSPAGTPGDSGDGGAAASALLNYPAAVLSGNGSQLYIADSFNNRIQEVARSSHTEWGQPMTANDIYTVAGNPAGNSGYSGDGGAATSALLDYPLQVALDGQADLFIADTLNNRVREVKAATAVISTIAGTGGTLSSAGNGGPALSAAISGARGVASDAAGDIYIADTGNSRVQEIAATTHTQWGIAMQAGYVYTVAGSITGIAGDSGDSGLATAALLSHPGGVAVDAAGDLYIADSYNSRIQEVAAASGTQWGQPMTAGDIYTVAGSATGDGGSSGDGGTATAALLNTPAGVTADAAGDLYIADYYNNRVQEVPHASGTQWGQPMTAGDMYTVAGSATGAPGTTGDGGAARSALLNAPAAAAVDTAGDLYIADSGNNRIQEIATASGPRFGQSMTAGDIYTIAGSPAGTYGFGGDGGPATTALLASPQSVAADSSGNLYVADNYNNRVQEIPAANGTQWSQSMTVGDIYTVVGSGSTWAQGFSGDGAPAASALLNNPAGVATDPSGNLYIADTGNNQIREVNATSAPVFPEAPAAGAVTITQPGGAQITFYPQSGGTCTAPYVVAGGYCTLPQNVGAALTFSSGGGGTYTFTPSPGTSYTYGSSGALESQADSAGNMLTITYGSPLPGAGNCPSTAATCETITSASGRALVAGSSSAGLVTSVTDPMARRWTYAYTGSDLTSVTDPMGNKTSYTYGQGSTGNPLLASDLLTITGPNAQPGGPDAGDATVNVYNAAGQVTSQTDPMGYRTTFAYTAMNTATGSGTVTVADPDGNTTVYAYEQGTLAAQSVWTGTTLTSEQDKVPDLAAGGTSDGTLLDAATFDGDQHQTSYTYDAAGNTTSATAPDGIGSQTATTTNWSTSSGDTSCDTTAQASSGCSSTQTGPSPAAPGGVITPPSSAPPAGVTYSLYDTDGNLLYTTTGVYQPGSNAASYSRSTYSLFKGNTITLGSNQISCTTVPPSSSLPCATINADGVVTQLAYDPQGDLTSSAVPDGNGTQIATTTYGYNGDGEQASKILPDGNLTGANAGNYTTITTFNADGEQASVTLAGGSGATVTPRATSYGYDGDGNQTAVKDARNYTTTTAYNADDKADLVTDPQGHQTLTCYDGDGNAAQTVPPNGVASGALTPASCPAAYPAGYQDRLIYDATAYTFDAAGNDTEMTTPPAAGQSGHPTTTYSYDGAGNLLITTGPPASGLVQQVTSDTYNSAGELATETVGYGTAVPSTTSFCYDPGGDQTSVVMPDGNTSATASCETSSPWVVSPASYPAQAAYQTTASYDSAGELVSSTTPATAAAPSGATTNSTYDPAGNMLNSTDPDGVTTTWTYTPQDLQATVSYSGSSAHSVTSTYDADGQKTATTDATGTSSFTYDPFGELTSTTNGANQTTGYSYDADGDPASITYPLPATATWATTHTVSYGYTTADALNQVTDFNGNTTTMVINGDSLPTSETLGTTGDTVTYTYAGTDSPSGIALTNSTSTLQSFTYTEAPAGNVTSETDTPASPQSPAGYTYDAQDRVESMTPGASSALNYNFDASGNLTTTPTGAVGAYDHNSELTSTTLASTTTIYTYNADGQRLAAKQGSATIASGSWNGAGQLIAYNNGIASMSTPAYDASGLRASAVFTPSGGTAATQNFVWDRTTSIPDLLMDAGHAYIYAGGNSPAEQVNLGTGAISYLVTDVVGSVRGIVNSSGGLTATTSYDAWGNPLTTSGLASYTPFGFAGGYTDPTGLIYLVNRYYDPAAGQFISLDPKVSQTKQPYSYAAGNPITNIDPTGLMYIVLYDNLCSVDGCVNITKICGRDNKCHLHWGLWMHNKNAREAYAVDVHWNLHVGTATVMWNYKYPHTEAGNYWWHGNWGIFKNHDWGYYVDDFGFSHHMGPDTPVSFKAWGPIVFRGGSKGSFIAVGAWIDGQRFPYNPNDPDDWPGEPGEDTP